VSARGSVPARRAAARAGPCGARTVAARGGLALGRAALALVAAACAGDPGRARPAAGPVVIAELAEPGVLLPVVEQSALDAEINDQLYLGLNSARWEDGHVVYLLDALALARAWRFEADSTALTYEIRADAVWSDGTPITADDVVFTYDLVRDTAVGSPYAYVWSNLDSVVARGPRTVTFYFARRNPDMLFATGINLVPRHVYADADRAHLRSHPRLADPAGGRLVVSGPYTVADWAKGDRLTLVANPRAFAARPAIERVVFRVVPEEATRLIELRNGTVDVTWPIPYGRAAEIEADPRLRIERVRARFYDFIAWNATRVPAFADPEVRRALSLGIDRAALLRALDMERYAEPADGPFPPLFRDVRDPNLRPDPYDPARARAILEARGFRDQDGDGILEREGRPFRFTLTTNAGNARREAVLQMVQAQLRRVGVDVRLRTLESNTFWNAFYGRTYEAALAGWQVAVTPDLSPFFYPGGALNVTGYANPRVTALLDSARAQPTEEAAARYWREAGRLVAEDRPYAFLYFFDQLVGVNERVRNTRIDTYGVYQNLYAWRLETPRAAAVP
jgi:peptide/nickel transport system substrate-binding protein